MPAHESSGHERSRYDRLALQSACRRKGCSLPGGGGDLYVRLNIVVSPERTGDERELFEKLAATPGFGPRDFLTGVGRER
ncbi:MAG: hypothetical protein M3361_11415 [Candidatus Tectomicrobia bacterium]|nr:hypothetical protein [Candidatus Tectomicrobia bacterium]